MRRSRVWTCLKDWGTVVVIVNQYKNIIKLNIIQSSIKELQFYYYLLEIITINLRNQTIEQKSDTTQKLFMNYLNQHRYFLRPDKVAEYKTQFYKQTCSRSGDQDQLNRQQLFVFLKKMGQESILSQIQYFNVHLFKDEQKKKYSCVQCIIILGRLAVSQQIESQFRDVFNVFDVNSRGIITAEELAKGLAKSSKIPIEPKTIDSIFAELDYDGDGIVNFEEFMCAMISK